MHQWFSYKGWILQDLKNFLLRKIKSRTRALIIPSFPEYQFCTSKVQLLCYMAEADLYLLSWDLDSRRTGRRCISL